MFTSLLPDDDLYRVYVDAYAERYYIKRFAKDYRGKTWLVTLESIKDDLRRVRALEKTQQADELKHKDSLWIFKYDFAIAKSGVSPKRSGNRCVVLLNADTHRIDILMVYGKGDLPKNQNETVYILGVVEREFPAFWTRFD